MEDAAGLARSHVGDLLSANILYFDLQRSKYNLSTCSSDFLSLSTLCAGRAAAGGGTVSGTSQGRSEAGSGAESTAKAHEGLQSAPGQERERLWSKLDAIFAKAAAERHASMQAASGQTHSEGAFGVPLTQHDPINAA